jgi:threonine dehydrogenase-like Zn-dependent dehydrogenase/predicted NBD/HSP70 family sugar kinase
MTAAICVDMGGTTTRVGVSGGERLLPGTVRFDTPKPAPGGSIRQAHLDRVAVAVERVRRAGPGGLREVGVAVGATVDAAGLVRNASMLWHEPSTGFDLVAALGDRLPWARLAIANDIAAAAWRYRSLGRFGLVTVSTGVAIKVFDDALGFDHKLLLDDDGLGGEVGHVRLDPPAVPAGVELPWCECGNRSDLCSYVSGPAAARLAGLLAPALPDQWRGSKLSVRCDGDPRQVTTADLAAAAGAGDGFTAEVLRVSTRPLAGHLLQISALLGLRRFVVMGGFAHGVGEPWFAALRANLHDLRPVGGWFTGWTGADLDALVRPSLDGDDSLIGMAAYLAARRVRHRELHKPVGEQALRVSRVDTPRCGRQQLLARVRFAGICGTDLQILRGERGCEPMVLGHECVAEVVEVGAEVSGVEAGQVIGVNPNHPLDAYDKLGHNQPGVLRELAVWDGHLVQRGQIVRLPAAGRAEWVLLEPLAAAVRSLRLAGDRVRGGTILVVGGGVAGLLHATLARRWKAARVLVAGRSPARRELAVARGIVPGGDYGAPASGVDVLVVAVSGGAGPAVVEQLWPVLADGASVHLFGGFAPGSELRTPGGRVVPAGPIRDGCPERVALPGGRGARLVGSRGGTVDDFRRAVELCRGGLDLAPLVTHVVSLEAAPAVLAELAATGQVAGEPALRVVVDMSLAGRSVRPVAGDLPRLGASS